MQAIYFFACFPLRQAKIAVNDLRSLRPLMVSALKTTLWARLKKQ